MSRYTGPIRFRGSVDARSSEEAGRSLLGELLERTPPGSANSDRRTLDDGTMVEARIGGGQHVVTIAKPRAAEEAKKRVEEGVLVFISSTGGLLIFDLTQSVPLATITGLDPYGVDAVSPDAKTVHMSGSGLAVVVDLPSLTAQGYAYDVDATTGSGRAMPAGMEMSPDRGRLLLGFGHTVDTGSGATIDAIGGMLLLDPETMAVVRPAIRMTYRPTAPAWRADSAGFFLGTVINTDPGDVADGSLPESVHEFVCAFDADGALQGSLLLRTWDNPPNAGFGRLIRCMAANGHGSRLYVLRQGEPVVEGNITKLHVIDTTNGNLALLETVHVDGLAESIGLTRGGTRLSMYFPDTDEVAEYDTSDDTPSLIARTAGFDTNAWTNGTHGSWRQPLIQNGPKSRVPGRPPDARRYFLERGTGTDQLRLYRSLDKAPVYTLALDGFNVDRRYRLASSGPRDVP